LRLRREVEGEEFSAESDPELKRLRRERAKEIVKRIIENSQGD